MKQQTPAAEWRVNGESDPHGDQYNCQREELTMGDWSDDALANAVFLYGNVVPDFQLVIEGKAKMPITYLTAAKDRIRWLSRRTVALEAEVTRLKEELAKHNPNKITPGDFDPFNTINS